MSHKDTLGNIISLEKWYSKLGVIYPSNEIKNSPIVDHDFYLDSNLENDTAEILGKSTPKVVFGCDNQISDLHAYCMFEHFYQQGGRIFDTAYIYNNGLSDKYLGNWIRKKNNRIKNRLRRMLIMSVKGRKK